MASTVATRPASKMSKASARRRGRSRTRSPGLTKTPATVTRSRRVFAPGSSQLGQLGFDQSDPELWGSVSVIGLLQRPGLAQRAVHPQPVVVAQRLGAIEQGAGALVQLAHGRLLGVGQGQDAQAQDFVDLGAVKQVAGRLGRDL